MSTQPSALARVSTPRRRRAFTLIELLTVIAIIGILAAILIPVIGKVRASARSASCLSNLREIGKQIMLYGNDNKQRLPTESFNVQGSYTNGDAGTQTAGGQSRITARSGILAFHLYPYINNTVDRTRLGTAGLPNIYHPNFICPSMTPLGSLSTKQALSYSLSTQPFDSPGSPFPSNTSRVFNHTTGLPTSGGLNESRYPLPLSRIWAVSDLDSQMAAGFSTTVMPVTPIHGNVRNRVYLDGHVKSMPISAATNDPWE